MSGKLFPEMRLIISLSAPFGSYQGGVMVESIDNNGPVPRSVRAAVYSATQSEIIPAILPSLAAQMVLEGKVSFSSIAPLPDWLPEEQFICELRKRGVGMAVQGPTTENWQTLC